MTLHCFFDFWGFHGGFPSVLAMFGDCFIVFRAGLLFGVK